MKTLSSVEELRACIEQSFESAVLIFKHSTKCPISADAFQRVSQFDAGASGHPEVYMVRVIEERQVSTEIAMCLGVPHQSPQIVLVRDGVAIWNTSHYGIHADRLAEALVQFGILGETVA